jgi:hypothetical protein
MPEPGQKPLILEEHERKAILAYCARTTVGFLSISNDRFYGSGALAIANGTWVILTAAHVVTAVEKCRDCKVVFSDDYADARKYPAVVREYSSLTSRVSNGRKGRKWNPAEFDIGLIVPSPSLLEGLSNLRPIDVSLDTPVTKAYTAATAVILGFPERLERTVKKDFGVVSNPVSTQFVPVPVDACPDDLALGWDTIYQVTANKFENAPLAGGMFGGPIFAYIREPIPGAWTAEKQMIFSGILHYQHKDNCLLGHNRHMVKDFVSSLLNRLENNELRDALAKGYKFAPK